MSGAGAGAGAGVLEAVGAWVGVPGEAVAGAVLQGLNAVTLLGALGVKAPQILKIYGAKSVEGLSERALVVEWVANFWFEGRSV